MSAFGLLMRNLFYHWRGNLAVALGMALGTAVLTGALFVGDSLRGSLRGLALDQLGWVDQALLANRFFAADLAGRIEAERKAPVLMLQGSVRWTREGETVHVAGVNIYGVDDSFWSEPAFAPSWGDATTTAVLLNPALAAELGLPPRRDKTGAAPRLELLLPRNDEMPRESLLGKRKAEDVVQSIRVDVADVLGDKGMANFSLRPSPVPPRNVFVPRDYLAKELGLVGRANVLLASGPAGDLKKAVRLSDWGYSVSTPDQRAKEWQRFMTERPKKDRLPNDLIKKLIEGYPANHPYLSLEGKRGIIEPALERAVAAVGAKNGRWRATPVLVYLADSLRVQDPRRLADSPAGLATEQVEVPYAVVAAVPGVPDPQKPANVLPLKGDEAYLAHWPASPFPKDATKIDISYFVPDASNNLHKKSHAFDVKGVLAMTGPLDDPYWTPPFPGITDKLSIGEWSPLPFIDLKRVKKIDDAAYKLSKTRPLDDFWKRYKTTPRVYVSLEKGQELWATRYGKLTSMRLEYQPQEIDAFVPVSAKDFRRLVEDLTHALLAELDPAAGGFVFQDVKTQALASGGGSTDFGVLFLAFSFFLIVAALLLVGLLVRLNLERRAQEMGVLLATGWTHRQVRRLLLGEGAILALVGSLLGLAAAFAYTRLLLDYLKASWPGGDGLVFLRLHANPLSIVIGGVSSVAASLLTLLWATRVLGKLEPRTLLAGTPAFTQTQRSDGKPWSRWIMIVSLLGALAAFVAGWLVEAHEAKAGSFFGCGALLLTAALAYLWRRLGVGQGVGAASDRQVRPTRSLTMLGVRNAGRFRLRSVLTMGLLAAATFLIVAVESFHKETGVEFHQKDHGSGGFALVAETDVPIFEDLNRDETRRSLDFKPGEEAVFKQASFFGFRARAGDDASCLNLYQPLKPRLLGASRAFRERGGFAFAKTLAETDEEKQNPWLLLERKADDAIPVFADANSATWILKVGLGDTIDVPTEGSPPVKLKVVGLLRESLFQSELILADEHFKKAFPHQEGFAFFLIECPLENADQTRKVLQRVLADQGFRVQSTRQRVQAYLAVENTYLATFQALGGLGLLLGAVGLAIVLLRGVWERRGELALLQALGFRKSALAWLVLVENAFLLVLGLAVGTVAALLAVTPHLLQAGAAVLWLRIGLLLGLVAAVGLIAGSLAVAASLRTPILTALRRE